MLAYVHISRTYERLEKQKYVKNKKFLKELREKNSK